jgi:hypothetical protein
MSRLMCWHCLTNFSTFNSNWRFFGRSRVIMHQVRVPIGRGMWAVDTNNPSKGRAGPAEYDLARDQTQLLEAKATLALRNSVVENVVAVQPTLKAVHRATHASPVERY